MSTDAATYGITIVLQEWVIFSQSNFRIRTVFTKCRILLNKPSSSSTKTYVLHKIPAEKAYCICVYLFHSTRLCMKYHYHKLYSSWHTDDSVRTLCIRFLWCIHYRVDISFCEDSGLVGHDCVDWCMDTINLEGMLAGCCWNWSFRYGPFIYICYHGRHGLLREEMFKLSCRSCAGDQCSQLVMGRVAK